jgi:hypothetical protein
MDALQEWTYSVVVDGPTGTEDADLDLEDLPKSIRSVPF